MTIYTRRGDSGETSLAGGARVPKDSMRVEAYGTVDEANSWIGLARSATDDELLGDVLRFTQHRLFNCSSQLASEKIAAPDSPLLITSGDIAALESAVDRFEETTGPVRGFVLEGG
jgi:cob(I)alamin adenosyltransferase